MKKPIRILTVLFACLLFASGAQASSFADTYGLSPKGMSMGNAMTAHVDDWSAIYYNVAGLGRTADKKVKPDVELFLGYLNTQPDTELDIPQRYYIDDEGARHNVPTNADEDLDYGQFILGLGLDLNMFYKMPEAISSARFGMTLGVGDDLAVTKVSDVEPQTHNYLRYGREAQQTMIMTGLGLGFLDDAFGLGLGVRTSFGGEGAVLLEDVQVGQDPQTPRQQATMDLELESALLAGLYIDMGKLIQPLEGMSLGASYKQESYFEVDPFSTASEVDVGGILLNLNLAIFDYYQPETYTGGVSYRFGKRLLVAADVEYQKWSDYKVSGAYEQLYADILPELDDIWIPKVGLQFDATDRTSLYLGYYYQPSFIPDEAANSWNVNWLDNDKHVGSIGVSYNTGKWGGLQKALVLHAGYQFQYLEDRKVNKTPPPGATANEISMNPDYEYGGTVHTVMLGVSF